MTKMETETEMWMGIKRAAICPRPLCHPGAVVAEGGPTATRRRTTAITTIATTTIIITATSSL
jgi:hypothetical protein